MPPDLPGRAAAAAGVIFSTPQFCSGERRALRIFVFLSGDSAHAHMHVYCWRCALLTVSMVSAHGPQIQITVDTANGNKIVTRQLLPGNTYSTTNGLTSPASVYVIPALPVSFLGQTVTRVKPLDTETFGPGFTYGYDQFVSPGGARPLTANLNLHLAGLRIWDGSAFVATGLNKEQLGLLQSSSNVNPDSVKTTASGSDLSIPIVANYTADEHSTVRYTLLGDGLDPYAGSRDGIYLATLQLDGTQASPILTSSAPFYYIIGRNVAPNDLTTVVNSFIGSQGISPSFVQYTANAVPEPGTVMLVALSGLGVSALSRVGRRRAGR